MVSRLDMTNLNIKLGRRILEDRCKAVLCLTATEQGGKCEQT